MTEQRKIALFDMDGTLVDYHKVLSKDMESLRAPNECEFDSSILHDEKIPEYIEKRKYLITNQPGWWENLPKYYPGWFVLNLCQSVGYKIVVLTKGPNNRDQAWTEKVKWVKKYLPDVTTIITSEDKSLVYGRVLVDDYPDYVHGWLKHRPRGLAIIPKSSLTDKMIPHNQIFIFDPQDPKSQLKLTFLLKDHFNRG